MADTIDVPAIGKTKKTYVYVGIAAVAGFVGFAYYKRASAPVDMLPAEGYAPDPELIPDAEYENPGSSDNGIWDLTGNTIDSNSEWSQRATTHLANIGFDPQMVAIALGKFFQREGLNPTEIDAVKAAVGQFGPPPEDGPWPIKAATATPNNPPPNNPPPGPAQLPAPTGGRVVSAGPRNLLIAWNPVPGAKSYAVRLRGNVGGIWAVWDYTEVPQYNQAVPHPNTDYQIYVQAQGPERADGSFPQSDLITISGRTSG